MIKSKKQHISTPSLNHKGKIGLPELGKYVDYDDLKPAFSFEYVQKKYCLSKWDKQRIQRLIDELGKFEQHKWKEIKNEHIFQFEPVDKNGLKVAIPNIITPDMSIYYMKPFGSNTKFRVFGVRDRHNFKFLWFDDKHEIYPGQCR